MARCAECGKEYDIGNEKEKQKMIGHMKAHQLNLIDKQGKVVKDISQR